MKPCVRRAHAKINLVLHVGAPRPDGYHEVETLFQAIDLADEVSVEVAGSDIELSVHGPDLGPPRDNLAWRAAAAYRDGAGGPVGVRLELRKRIPAGAGLGGGSSDAAAVLECLARLCGDTDRARLRAIGATLGADVGFFLGDGALALGRGRGEVLTPLEPLPVADIVVVAPREPVSTAAAYRALARARLHAPTPAPEPLRAPSSWDDVRAMARNDFQALIAARHPSVARALRALEDAGASPALLSGSGGASWGLFADRSAATAAARRLSAELGWPCWAARTLVAAPRS